MPESLALCQKNFEQQRGRNNKGRKRKGGRGITPPPKKKKRKRKKAVCKIHILLVKQGPNWQISE